MKQALARLPLLEEQVRCHMAQMVQMAALDDELGRVSDEPARLRVELDAEVQEALAQRRELMGLLATLTDPKQYGVLYRRYLLGWPWERIAGAMGCTVRNTTYLHDKGLAQLTAPGPR